MNKTDKKIFFYLINSYLTTLLLGFLFFCWAIVASNQGSIINNRSHFHSWTVRKIVKQSSVPPTNLTNHLLFLLTTELTADIFCLFITLYFLLKSTAFDCRLLLQKLYHRSAKSFGKRCAFERWILNGRLGKKVDWLIRLIYICMYYI